MRYKTKSGKILTEKQTKFVHMMLATGGNRIESISTALDIDMNKKGWKITASAIASEYLLKPNINEALSELFCAHKLTDEDVDRELQYVIDQKAELSPKVKAINEYNKITGRHAEEKRRITFENLSDEELRKEAARIIEEAVTD